MKKLVLGLGLLLSALAGKAQSSAMYIENHTPCDALVYLSAGFPYLGYANCFYESSYFTIPGFTTWSAPSYWDWASTYVPFVPGPTVAPPIGGGPAPAYGAPNAFVWTGVLIFHGWTTGVPAPPPVNGMPASACGPAEQLGPCLAPLPGAKSTWNFNAATGDVRIDIF